MVSEEDMTSLADNRRVSRDMSAGHSAIRGRMFCTRLQVSGKANLCYKSCPSEAQKQASCCRPVAAYIEQPGAGQWQRKSIGQQPKSLVMAKEQKAQTKV